MNGSIQSGTESSIDRRLFFIVRVVLGLIAFPIVTLLVAMGLTEGLIAVGRSEGHEVGGILFATISGVIIGLATSVFIGWKSDVMFRKSLVLLRTGLREPVVSCIEFGVVGALLFGGVMLAGILLFGHARPASWSFDRIPTWMALGSAIFVVVGLPVGLWRKRRRSSSAQDGPAAPAPG
jgi:hypothetical protein